MLQRSICGVVRTYLALVCLTILQITAQHELRSRNGVASYIPKIGIMGKAA